MKLIGVTIFTDNVEKLTNFYKVLLGTDPVETSNMSSLFEINDFRYFIHKHHEPDPDLPPSEDHYEFKVENLEEDIQTLTNRGLKVEYPPKEYYLGKSAYLRDQDGRLIELHEN